MRVLYVNDTAQMSGAEQSLLELLRALPDTVSATVACPAGPLATAVDGLGVEVAELPPMRLTFTRHPLRAVLGCVSTGAALVALRRLTRRLDPDIVHANSIRAGLETLGLRRSNPPVVVHVRDCLPRSLSGELVRRALRWHAAAVLANSDYTAASFAPNGSRARVRTVYNAVDLTRFDPSIVGRGEARTALGLDAADPVLAVIGQLTPWKAQDDAIRALARVRESEPRVRLLLAGSVKFRGGMASARNDAFAHHLRRLAGELGVTNAVHFLGERDDVPRVLRAADVVLAPSWEEPFGRSIVEAMAMGTAVVATSVGGPPELITDGDDGLLVAPRQPALWAAAIVRLLHEPGFRARLADRGRVRARESFSPRAHVQAVLAAYEEILEAKAQ